jgi:glycine C-acetyltransferase
MMNKAYLDFLSKSIQSLKESGLYKSERIITSPQDALIQTLNGQDVINLCANNYLGLANHPEIIQAAREALKHYGYGMSSVRFICGTQTIHKALEHQISQFLQTEDTILYSSCFDANTGLFETLLNEEDAIISDALNHASIIDGIRLCKAKRLRYANNNMSDLAQKLKESQSCRFRLIATDGVFSMDGLVANLPKICELAEQYNALVMVDDSHAVGFMGKTGRGTPEYWDVREKVDILTGTLGKALGGASGGYTSGRKEIITWLRQRSRPYLFSNTLAPVIAATSLKALELLDKHNNLRETLMNNSRYFRQKLIDLGFSLTSSEHPIIPVLLGDAQLAATMAEALLKHGVYVISFSYPVVPEGQARIRTQVSARHTLEQLDKAIWAFATVGRELNVI